MPKTPPPEVHVMKCILSLILLLVGASAWAGDWPQFHGPKRDNISLEKNLLKKWPENGPELIWTAKGLGYGFSSVSIASGMIYTAGNIDEDTVVTALERYLLTGELPPLPPKITSDG